MKGRKYILYILCTAFLTGCGVQKRVKSSSEDDQPSVVSTWHTCLIQGAKAVISTNEERISATVTMQTVHDSLLIISIMPMMGIEMARIEATPTELIAFDKINGQYAQTTYEELNRRVTPSVTWKTLQQLCSAELPTGDQNARIVYHLGEDKLDLDLTYTPRKTDVPLRMNRLRTDKYKKIDISKWLR